MPRDNDKDNASSRGRVIGLRRQGTLPAQPAGPTKKFAKRDFAGKGDGKKPPHAGKSEGAKSYGKKPYAGPGKPYAGKREGPPPRRDYGDAPRPAAIVRNRARIFRPRDDRGGEKRLHPRGDRPNGRDDRAPRSDARPAGNSPTGNSPTRSLCATGPWREKRPGSPRGEGFRERW